MNTKKLKYAFELDDEKLELFKNFSAKEKLQWLAEINMFLNKVLTKQQKIKWERLRKKD